MNIERKTAWIFGINAVINWFVSVRGIVDPVGWVTAFGGDSPDYLFLFRLWSGFIFMFGWMFWEVSRNVNRKAALIKYNWIEKTITATCVTLGFLSHEVPMRVMVLITFTNWLWIPLILYCDIAVHRNVRSNACSEVKNENTNS